MQMTYKANKTTTKIALKYYVDLQLIEGQKGRVLTKYMTYMNAISE